MISSVMEYSNKELELAQRYKNGEYNDVQFNFLVVQNKFDKKRIEELVEKLGYEDPIAIGAKFIILCMMIHFAACLFYSMISK